MATVMETRRYKKTGLVTEASHYRPNTWEIALLCFVLASLLFLGFQSRAIENTFGALQFSLLAIIPGALSGWLAAWLTVNTGILTKETKIYSDFFFVMLIPAFAFISIGLAFQINTNWGDEKSYRAEAKVVEKARSKSTHLLYLQFTGGRKRIAVDRDIWETLTINETINLNVRRGYFGYPVITGVSSDSEKRQSA